MKKRLLSLLLVACMLLSMVPVFSAVAIAEEMPVGEATEPYDYSKLYVTAGLVGLYTSFKGENYFDLSQMNGTWQNRVNGGAPAVLGQSKAWTTEAHGGLGFVLTEYQTSATEGSHAYLGLPEEYTAMDNFTIEFFANMRYVTNADGTRGGTYSGTSTYAFRLGFLSLSGPLNGNRLDWRPLYTRYTLDNLNWGNMMNDPLGGTLNVYGSTSTLQDWYTAKNTSGKIYSDLHSELIVGTDARIGATGPLAFTKVTADNDDATFGYYNLSATGTIGTWTKAVMDKAESTTITYEKDGEEITENKKNLGTTLSTALFFNSLPTFLYAVRVYDDALTDTEKMQNFFADVCGFYQLDMTAFEALPVEERAAAVSAAVASFKTITMDNADSDVYAAGKQMAQIYLNVACGSNGFNEYDKLYVGADGKATANGGKLTALFTAYGDGSAVAGAGVWVDKASGKHATLKGNLWQDVAGGGVGYFMQAGVNQRTTAAGYTTVSTADPYYTVDDAANCYIEMPKNLLIGVEDYTLDMVYNVQTKVYHTDASGNLTNQLYIPSNIKVEAYAADANDEYTTLVTTLTLAYSALLYDVAKSDVLLWCGATGASPAMNHGRNVCTVTVDENGNYVFDKVVINQSADEGLKSLGFDTTLYKADGSVYGKGVLIKLTYVSEARTQLWSYNTKMHKIGLLGAFGFYNVYTSATAQTVGYQHRFYIQYGAGLHWDSGGRYSGGFWESGTNTISSAAIQTASFTRDVTGTGDAQTQAYVIYKNGAKHTSATINTHGQKGDDAVARDYLLETDASKFDFYLFSKTPGTVYAIRMYDALLTDDEKAQNHFADIAAYFELDVSEIGDLLSKMSENARKSFYHTFDDVTFANGNKEALQKMIDTLPEKYKLNDYDLLYVGANGGKTANGGELVLFYNAFKANSSADLEAGVWYDKAHGNNATFINATGTGHNPTWTARGENGVGYDMYGGQLKADGTVNTKAWYSVPKDHSMGVRLALPVNALLALNNGDYTMDYVSEFHDVKVRNEAGTGDANVQVDAGWQYLATAIGSFVSVVGRGKNVTFNSACPRQARWAYINTAWGTGHYNFSEMYTDQRTYTTFDDVALNSIVRSHTDGVPYTAFVFYEYDEATSTMGEKIGEASKSTWTQYNASTFPEENVTYTMTSAASTVSGDSGVNVYTVSAKDGGAVVGTNLYSDMFPEMKNMVGKTFRVKIETRTTTSVKMEIYKNGALAETGTTYTDFIRSTSTSAGAYYRDVSRNYFISDSTFKNFFLFQSYPCTVYSVRFYSGALTAAEKAQNHFADVCAYYALDLSAFNALDAEDKADFYTVFSDVALGKADAAILQAQMDSFAGAFAVNAYDLLYVGMDGSETANGGKLTMFLSAMAGTNSANLTVGKWYDKTGNYHATFVGSKSVIWDMRGANGVGYDMLGGSLKEDGTYNTSSNYNFTNEVTLTLDLEALKALSDGGYNLDAVAEYHSLLWYDQNGILQSGAYNNNKLGSYTTYSEWIGNLKNIYNRADVQQDLHARQVRWFTAPGGTGWGGGQYYFNSQLHDEQSRLGGGISTYSFVRTLTENVEFDTWIFTYADGTTVEIGKDKLAAYNAANTKSFLVDGTEYEIKTATKTTTDGDANTGNIIEHSFYEIFVGDTKVATNLYYKYEYLRGGSLATVICNEMFNSLKEGTVTVTEGKTTTSEYTLAINEDFAKVKLGTYYTSSLVTSSSSPSRADYANNSLNGYVKDSKATKFEMFHRAPCSIYGIRLYDAPLTDAENAQNHFADLCAYYLVDIAGFADATADAKAAAYASVTELKLLAEGDAEYVATKAKVQAAIDNAKATAFEAGETLPTVIEGVADRVVAVWVTLDGETKYLPGTVLAEGATLYPVLVHKGETVDGAGVNLAVGGIRFKTTFLASDYYILGNAISNRNAKLSMIIAPELYVEKLANGVFTKEALTDKDGNCNYVEVAINGYYDLVGDTYVLAGGLKEFTDVTKENDLAFAAVLCLTVTVGDESYEIYGDYNAETNRSGLDVLTPYAEKVIAGELTVGSELADDLLALYTGFTKHDPDLAAALRTALGLN